jgi:hypothetical protein
MVKTQIKLELKLYSDFFEPNEFTKLIGIQPTDFWYKGDEIPIHTGKEIIWEGTKKPTRKSTCWEYATDYIETYDISDLSEPLLNMFEPYTDIIAKFVKENNLDVWLGVVAEWNINESTPAVGANKRLIQFLSKIGGQIDIDLYVDFSKKTAYKDKNKKQ